MPTRCNRRFFIADLIACSACFGHHYARHQELEIIIQLVAACGLWCLVSKLSVWCGAEGCVSGLQQPISHNKSLNIWEARSHGDASGRGASTTQLDAPNKNLQNIKDKHADQPAIQRATTYRIQVLPLMNRRGWNQIIFKYINICIMYCAIL
jgi:hypothetical protein